MSECKHELHEHMPQWGVAPHNCYYKIGAPIGGSQFLLPKYDPENFVRCKDNFHEGMYFCPDCLEGKQEYLEYFKNPIDAALIQLLLGDKNV